MAAVESKIANCETIIGYTFSNKRLLHEALQTSGVGAVPKNTRLAVYGNMALNKELCHLWWTMDLDKGSWTAIRNTAQNSGLKDVGFQHGLDACVILNGGTTVVSDKTMASTVEAVVGAVELDCGSQAMMQVATRLGLVHASLAPSPSISDSSLVHP